MGSHIVFRRRMLLWVIHLPEPAARSPGDPPMNRSGSATLLRLKIGIIEQAAIATAFKFGDHLVVIIRHVQAAPVVAVLPPTEAPRNRASLSRRGQPCVKRRRPLPKAGSGADALALLIHPK